MSVYNRSVFVAGEKIQTFESQHAGISNNPTALKGESEPAGRGERGFKYCSPCFCMHCKNLTMTLEDGRISTWRFPRFSALERVLRQSARTDMRTMVEFTCWGVDKAVRGGWGGGVSEVWKWAKGETIGAGGGAALGLGGGNWSNEGLGGGWGGGIRWEGGWGGRGGGRRG